MIKEKEPKGKGERPDKRVLPKGRRPNPTLSGGEGIEPYEIYSNVLAELRKLANQQACTWYCSFDVCAFSRYDQVIHPPKALAPRAQSSSSTGNGNGEGQGADKERGPGLPSGPQQKELDDVNGLGETKGCAIIDSGATVMCSSTAAAEEIQMQRLNQS